MSLEEAVLLLSAAGDIRLCQCQPGADDIGVAARLEMPKEILGMKDPDTLF